MEGYLEYTRGIRLLVIVKQYWQPTTIQLSKACSNYNPTEFCLAKCQRNCREVPVELNWLITHSGRNAGGTQDWRRICVV